MGYKVQVIVVFKQDESELLTSPSGNNLSTQNYILLRNLLIYHTPSGTYYLKVLEVFGGPILLWGEELVNGIF